MVVCCWPSPSLLTAGLPNSGENAAPQPLATFPGLLSVGMGALLRKAVGSLGDPAKGV